MKKEEDMDRTNDLNNSYHDACLNVSFVLSYFELQSVKGLTLFTATRQHTYQASFF